MNIIPSKYKAVIGIAVLSSILAIIGVFFSVLHTTDQAKEIREIKSSSDLEVRSLAYRALIERVGIAEAQELLRTSGLPFNGETHLVNHTAGDWLYENFGPAGLSQCEDYFLGSCYHGVVLNTIAEHGLDGVETLMESCYEAGSATAAACAHGIGHGLLVWTGYAALPQAAAHCERFKERDARFPAFNCYDGVFMENVWGVHAGEPSKERWVDNTDPLYPCNDPRIQPEWRAGCYSNQASILFPLFDGDVPKAGEMCEQVIGIREQAICFDGIARQIHPIIEGDMRGVFALCETLTSPWDTQCILSIVSADFSTGGHTLPYELCRNIDTEYTLACYTTLFDTISFTLTNSDERVAACTTIVDPVFQESCLAHISN